MWLYEVFNNNYFVKHLWTAASTFSLYQKVFVTNQKQPIAVFFKIDVLKNLAILTGKHLCWSLFNKNAGLQLYYKQTPTQLFSCEFSEFFEDRFF